MVCTEIGLEYVVVDTEQSSETGNDVSLGLRCTEALETIGGETLVTSIGEET